MRFEDLKDLAAEGVPAQTAEDIATLKELKRDRERLEADETGPSYPDWVTALIVACESRDMSQLRAALAQYQSAVTPQT